VTEGEKDGGDPGDAAKSTSKTVNTFWISKARKAKTLEAAQNSAMLGFAY
jgi:hypothetical protein